MQQMSSDLNERVADATGMTEEKYDELVDLVTSKYRKAKKIKESDLEDFADELKAHWKNVKKEWQA